MEDYGEKCEFLLKQFDYTFSYQRTEPNIDSLDDFALSLYHDMRPILRKAYRDMINLGEIGATRNELKEQMFW